MYTDYDDVPRNPIMYGLITLVCGVAGTVIVFLLPDLSAAAAVLGAIGLALGGYAISVANRSPASNRVKYMAIAGAGIMTSVIAFMFGFVNFLA
ncbi:MAG: hypothetical protein LBG63_03340 [Candidatus Methanoplasma sp.]|jgi:hypothetical protein|nr:hypothetical protein [Candidatus Methanoplasma sp.]